MRCKILTQSINNKDSLLKELTMNNILTHPMNNNVKKSLINEAFNQSDINNTLKEQINDNSKKSLTNDTLKKIND